VPTPELMGPARILSECEDEDAKKAYAPKRVSLFWYC
jgi:hypothetical protein